MDSNQYSLDDALKRIEETNKTSYGILDVCDISKISESVVRKQIYSKKIDANFDGKIYHISKDELKNIVMRNRYILEGYLPLEEVRMKYFSFYKSRIRFNHLVKLIEKKLGLDIKKDFTINNLIHPNSIPLLENYFKDYVSGRVIEKDGIKYYSLGTTADAIVGRLVPNIETNAQLIRKRFIMLFDKAVRLKTLPYKRFHAHRCSFYFPEPIYNLLTDYATLAQAMRILGKKKFELSKKYIDQGKFRRVKIEGMEAFYSLTELLGGKAPDVSEAMALIKYFKDAGDIPNNLNDLKPFYEITVDGARLRYNADGNNGVMVYVPGKEPDYLPVDYFSKKKGGDNQSPQDKVINCDVDFGKKLLKAKFTLLNFKFFNFTNRIEEWRKQMNVGFSLLKNGYLDTKKLEFSSDLNLDQNSVNLGSDNSVLGCNLRVNKKRKSKKKKFNLLTKEERDELNLIENSSELEEILSERENEDQFSRVVDDLDKNLDDFLINPEVRLELDGEDKV